MNSPYLPICHQQAIMHRLREKLALANLKLQRNYTAPELVWQQHGTAAGTAWLTRYEIHLNPVLMLENQQAFIDEVLPHELAHLLVWKHFGQAEPHGKEWKWIMEEVLAAPARQTHQFNLDSLYRNAFLYHCKCQQHPLTALQHNRVLCGETVYYCITCGQPLRGSPTG